jgi:hypothetical protein
MPIEKHKGRQPRNEITDALVWGGLACTSSAGPVMGLEQGRRMR